MTQKIYSIIHFIDSAAYGGTEQALVHLLARLDRNCWKPVLFHHPGPGIVPLLEEVHRMDIETRSVPRLKGGGIFLGLPKFIHGLRAENPAIFHAHLNWLLSCKMGLIGAALTGVPLVIATLQQYLLPPWGKNIYLQQRLVSSAVEKYIAVSHTVAQQLTHDFQVPQSKVKVIHNSIPIDQYNVPSNGTLRKALNRGQERPIVLTVARLDEQKGHKYLLAAISQIPEAVFVLAGDGPQRAALEAQAHRLGVADRLLFLGYRTDIPDLLASCDLFVLPSVYEGLPLSILEAMAAGKPVIATAVGGSPEAVLDGETGFLVPPGDHVTLAKMIRKVLSYPALAQKMGAAGKARVQQKFSVDAMTQRVIQTYEELLDRNKVEYQHQYLR